MDGILLDPLQVKDSVGTTVNPATADLQTTLQDLVARLDALAACKSALNESLRVHVIGNISQAVTGTISNTEVTPTGPNMVPTLARFINHMAVGNTAAVVANINNATA